MQDYIIVTPAYRANSNGIKTLHKICHAINNLGGKARLHFIASNSPECQEIIFGQGSWTNPEWNTPPLQESELHLIQTAHVIYPEVMIGNPLNAKKVIRYFGNREAYCNGQMIGIGGNDFLVAHSTKTRSDAHFILHNAELSPFFHDRDTQPSNKRTLDVTYIGKGYLYGKVGVVANTVLIGREWPVSQEQLAILLRQVRCFFTWDSWTAINVEAVLCGAVPYFMRYEPWAEDDIDNSGIGPIPRLDTNHGNFDPVKFMEERRALLERINKLTSSWDERVRNFMQRAEAHFSARGL